MLEKYDAIIIYKNTGAMVFKSKVNNNLVNVMASLDKLGVGYLELSCEQMKKYLPDPDLRSYFPRSSYSIVKTAMIMTKTPCSTE